MIRRVSSLGFIWSVVIATALALYAVASWRSDEPMQTGAAIILFCASAVCLATPFVRSMQVGYGAAVRVAFTTSAFLFRSLALVVVGSSHSDRTGQLIGAGVSACLAAAVVLMRLQFEVTIAAAVNASTD